MNCLDYRRVLLAGEVESAEMKRHRLACTACADLQRDHAAFEQELATALAVEPPPDFEARVIAPVVASRRRFVAAAAVATLAIGGGTYAWLVRDDPLALACIDFVMKEEAKSIMMGSMPRPQAEAALSGMLPLTRLESIGQVRHIAPCPFGGAMAVHVVLAVPQGKVTLLVMPGAKPGGGVAAHDGMHSAVVGMPNATIGIVAADATVVRSVANAVSA